MRTAKLGAIALFGLATAIPTTIDLLTAQVLKNLDGRFATDRISKAGNCTLENAAVRREWSTLPTSEKRNYIDAVLCLGKTPARTPAAVSEGAISRYDDFVVTHIQQTRTIHFTALRNECGYEGYLPYWNWAKDEDPRKSALFDGSDTSLSGDGAYIAGRNATCVPSDASCFIRLEPATGGGCVTSSPFKNWTVHLGPVQIIWKNIPPNPRLDGLGYNPRCLSRELNSQASMTMTDQNIGDLGIHGGGHYTIGGDANGDLFNSASNPAFFAHHNMIDLVWWAWQSLGHETRQNAIAGMVTIMNNPSSRNTTLADDLDIGFAGVPNITMGSAMNTLTRPFCYVYA